MINILESTPGLFPAPRFHTSASLLFAHIFVLRYLIQNHISHSGPRFCPVEPTRQNALHVISFRLKLQLHYSYNQSNSIVGCLIKCCIVNFITHTIYVGQRALSSSNHLSYFKFIRFHGLLRVIFVANG